MSQLGVETRVLRESEAEAAAQRARQNDEEEQLWLISERSVADQEEAKIRRRVAELGERARLDRLFGSRSRLGLGRASRSLAHVGLRVGRVLREDSPLRAEPDEDERSRVGCGSTSVLRAIYPRRQLDTPGILWPRADRALVEAYTLSRLSTFSFINRVLNSRPRLPAADIARYNTLPLGHQRLSSCLAPAPAPARGHNTSNRGRRHRTVVTTTTTSSNNNTTYRGVNMSPLPSITSYSLDEVLARSRYDAFPRGPYTTAVEELNDAELQVAINESVGGRYHDEEEEAIQRNRGIPTYEEACRMNIYRAPRGRRYVFQGPSSVTFNRENEGGGEVKWVIVGDMDLREAVRIANKNVK